jgi:hypothetical protein
MTSAYCSSSYDELNCERIDVQMNGDGMRGETTKGTMNQSGKHKKTIQESSKMILVKKGKRRA